MSEIEIPVRNVNRRHRCMCILLPEDEEGDYVRDRCFDRADMDQPVCDFCEANGHSDYPNAVPLSTVLLWERENPTVVKSWDEWVNDKTGLVDFPVTDS